MKTFALAAFLIIGTFGFVNAQTKHRKGHKRMERSTTHIKKHKDGTVGYSVVNETGRYEVSSGGKGQNVPISTPYNKTNIERNKSNNIRKNHRDKVSQKPLKKADGTSKTKYTTTENK